MLKKEQNNSKTNTKPNTLHKSMCICPVCNQANKYNDSKIITCENCQSKFKGEISVSLAKFAKEEIKQKFLSNKDLISKKISGKKEYIGNICIKVELAGEGYYISPEKDATDALLEEILNLDINDEKIFKITKIAMTKEEFNSLPEFEGF